MLISMTFDAKLFHVSVSTRLPVLNTDSEDTIEARGVSKSRAMMESAEYVGSCDFHPAKISKFLNPEFVSISGGIA